MTAWWSYRLEDFLMFAPRTWWRMVEQHNTDAWPAPLVAFAAGLFALWLARFPRAWTPRALAAVLAVAWLCVGVGFHAQRHAEINLLGPWLAGAFGLQAMLLGAVACGAGAGGAAAPPARGRAIGLAIAALAVLAYPLAGLPFGRPLAQAEVFGWMPDPTALATLGWLLAGALAVGRAWRALLAVIPVLALAAGWLTRLAMGQ